MKPKTKSALVLFTTLILGVAIGVMAWSTYHNREVARARSLRTQGALSEVVSDAIGDMGVEQRALVLEIVKGVEDELTDLFHLTFRTRTTMLDSMREELNPILSEQQIDRMDAWFDRNRRSSRSGARHDSTSGANRESS